MDHRDDWILDSKYKSIGFFTGLPIGIDKELNDDELVRAYAQVNSKSTDSNLNDIINSEPIKKCNEKMKSGFLKAKREEKKQLEIAKAKSQTWTPRVPTSKNKAKRKWKKSEKAKVKRQWMEKKFEQTESENKALKIEFVRLRKFLVLLTFRALS